MRDTLEKMEEARYFLSCMKSDLINVSHFKFNLSAFLSAARSVTLIIQKELSPVPGFSDWYSRKQNKFETDKLMKFFNKKRVLLIHEEPVRPRKEVHIAYKDSIHLNDKLAVFVLHADGSTEIREGGQQFSGKKTIKNKPDVKHLWFFDDMPNQDLISLCEEYLEKLQQLVMECQSKFGFRERSIKEG